MSPYVVRVGSAAILAAVAAFARPASAQPVTYTFQGSPISLSAIPVQGAQRAIAVDDSGLRTLLNDLGATITWQRGDRYILVTTAEPAVISFALGEKSYDVGPMPRTAQIAPFMRDGRAYLPLDALLSALELAPKPDGSQVVLQPQLAALDVRGTGSAIKIVAHAGVPLSGRIVRQDEHAVVVVFDGVGSTVPAVRTFTGGPVRQIDVQTAGAASRPRTIMTLQLAPGSPRAIAGTDDQRDFTIAIGAGASIAQQVPPAPQAPVAGSPAPAAPAVTSVQVHSTGGGAQVRIALTGAAAWDWHRLRPPDNRWWIDIHGARLSFTPQAIGSNDPISAVRVRPQGDGVRVALSLANYNDVSVAADAGGITVSVSRALAALDVPRSGSNTGGVAAAYATPAPSPGWRFTALPSPSRFVARNPRLIVIDPGHGGSDAGSLRGDAVEKTFTLDMARRLRAILVARGWQVMMTRDSDRDVYAPNDSADDELQARDNVANSNGARVFVSIHVNAFMNAGPHGATTFYYKTIDLPLAQAVDRRIAQELTIKDDGIVRNMLYVVHHATMPAILVETAFISNPDDLQLLESPSWRQAMAKAIADGITDYIGNSS